MTIYSYMHHQKYFNITLPKSVVDLTKTLKFGECNKFHFMQPYASSNLIASEKKELRTRSILLIKALEDGSLTITNLESADKDLQTKNVYVVENEENVVSKSTPQVSSTESNMQIMTQPSLAKVVPEKKAVQVIAIKSEQDEVDEPEIHDHDYFVPHEVMDRESDNDDRLKTDFETMKEHMEKIVDKCQELSTEGLPVKKKRRPYAARVSKDSKSPKCGICGTQAKDAYNLIKHLRRQHPLHERRQEEYKRLKPLMSQYCETCGQMYSNPKTLKEHIEGVHGKNQELQCESCDKLFRTRLHLHGHVKNVHMRSTERSHSCEICSRLFFTRKVLRNHILYHHSNAARIHECDQCTFKYAFQKQFYEHKTRVHGPKNEKCEFCGYKCTTKWYMKKHQKVCCKANSNKCQISLPGDITSDVNVLHNYVVKTPAEFIVGVQVSEVLDEIENSEAAQVEAGTPVTELPVVDLPMWNVEIAGNQMMTEMADVEGTVEEVTGEEQLIIVGPEDQYQQLAIVGEDGTPQIIQLIVSNPNTV